MKIQTKIDVKNQSSPEDEWLVTNGKGGFACGSLSSIPFRKHHSYLNAALDAPYGRTNMLNLISETLLLPNQKQISLSHYLLEFRLENGLPLWRYDIDGILLEKDLFFVHLQNTLYISYRLLTDVENVILKWQPFFHFRTFDQPINVEIPDESYRVSVEDFRYQIECPNFPPLRIYHEAHPQFVLDHAVQHLFVSN